MRGTRFFKRLASEERCRSIRAGLKRARLARSPEEWLASAIAYSVIAGTVALATSYFAFSLLVEVPVIYSVPLGLLVALASGYTCYRIFLYYPNLVAKNRKKEIDDMLPHAVAFMLALGKGGFEPIEIFRSLSERREEYGEISREAGAIYRSAKLSGYSPTEAIREVAETTPSERLKDFLNSLTSVVETSADITGFLSRKCEEYYSGAEEEQRKSLEALGIFSEVYVVALGLGPLLAIIVLVLMGMMGRFYILPLRLLVYVGIPLGSVLFALVLDMQARSTVGVKRAAGGSSAKLPERFSRRRRIDRLRETLRSPFRTFTQAPTRVLWASLPTAAIFAAYSVYSGLSVTTTTVLASLISLVPYSIFYELRRRRTERMVKATPDFLTAFSSAVTSGLTPARALKTLPSSRFGALAPELERVRGDVEWGSTIREALSRMAKRIRSGLLRWVIHLLERAVETASDLDGVLDVLVRDVRMERSMKDERRRVTFTYMVIIYITFGVFLLTAYSVSTSFVPLLPGAPSPAGGGLTVGGIEPSTVRLTFFHASLVQAFCSGLLAGKLETGEILSGLKHSAVMMVAAWLVFSLLVL